MRGIAVATWDERSFDPEVGSSVFVLGAGLSRAVDARMPLTDQLGNMCLPHVQQRFGRGGPTEFSGGYFETYLSALAADQPFLSSAENDENHALFERFSSAIGTVLGECQDEVLAGQPPVWLFEFLAVAHKLRAAVLTFNYDTLLECLVTSPFGPLDDPHDGRGAFDPFCWDELTGGVPAWPPGPARWGQTRRETLRLLKLHGSLNWYWSPGDSSGATVAKRDLPGTWLHPVRYQEGDRQRELPGRVPFIVPPTATKSPFYGSPQLREFWQQARRRIETASHIFLLGYSLPASDTTTGTMFRTALESTTSSIVVADLYPEPVVNRLRTLGVPESRIKVVPKAGPSPIKDLCDHLAAQLSSRTLASLRSTPAGEPLAVSWGNHCHAYVKDINPTADALTLVLDRPVASFAEINQGRCADAKLNTDLEPLSSEHLRLSAVLPDGNEQHLVDHLRLSFNTGRGQWRVLRPSGPSPLSKAE